MFISGLLRMQYFFSTRMFYILHIYENPTFRLVEPYIPPGGGDEATALSSGFGKELMDGDGTIRMDF